MLSPSSLSKLDTYGVAKEFLPSHHDTSRGHASVYVEANLELPLGL